MRHSKQSKKKKISAILPSDILAEATRLSKANQTGNHPGVKKERGLNLGLPDIMIQADAERMKSALLTKDTPLQEAAHLRKIPLFKI